MVIVTRQIKVLLALGVLSLHQVVWDGNQDVSV